MKPPELPSERDLLEPIFMVARSYFEDGEKDALLFAIVFAARNDVPLPRWAAEAYLVIWQRAREGEIKSWDEVFGKPWGKGSRRAAPLRAWRRSLQVWRRIKQLSEAGEPITDDLFARVGVELGMSRPVVNRTYYKMKKCEKVFKEFQDKFGPQASHVTLDALFDIK
jgi:hypothetical protein